MWGQVTWENGYIESFNGKLRDELLNGEVLTDAWRRHYNNRRHHSALEYRPPKPVVIKQPYPNSGCGYIGGGRANNETHILHLFLQLRLTLNQLRLFRKQIRAIKRIGKSFTQI